MIREINIKARWLRPVFFQRLPLPVSVGLILIYFMKFLAIPFIEDFYQIPIVYALVESLLLLVLVNAYLSVNRSKKVYLLVREDRLQVILDQAETIADSHENAIYISKTLSKKQLRLAYMNVNGKQKTLKLSFNKKEDCELVMHWFEVNSLQKTLSGIIYYV